MSHHLFNIYSVADCPLLNIWRTMFVSECTLSYMLHCTVCIVLVSFCSKSQVELFWAPIGKTLGRRRQNASHRMAWNSRHGNIDLLNALMWLYHKLPLACLFIVNIAHNFPFLMIFLLNIAAYLSWPSVIASLFYEYSSFAHIPC